MSWEDLRRPTAGNEGLITGLFTTSVPVRALFLGTYGKPKAPNPAILHHKFCLNSARLFLRPFFEVTSIICRLRFKVVGLKEMDLAY